MEELLSWLKQQNGGIGSFAAFHGRALALLPNVPEHAALIRMLADMADRFVSAYDGEPLSSDIADRALLRLVGLVEQGMAAASGSATERIAFLNEVGLAELV